MGNTEKIVDTCLLTIGGSYALANIEHFLGILILTIQLAWLAIKLVTRIVNTIKHEEPLDTIDDEVGSVIDKLSSIKDSLTPEENTDENGNDTEQE